MTGRIFRAIILVAMTVLIAGIGITGSFLYGYINDLQSDRLKEELALATVGVEQVGNAYFDNFRSQAFRFTLVGSDGTVFYDSQVDLAEMDNHLAREEVQEARLTGRGHSERYSDTLTERTAYEAQRLNDGSVLRVSATYMTVGAFLLAMLPTIGSVILISVLVAFFLSRKMAKSIVRPLDELDLDRPSANDTYEELVPILTRLAKQHQKIMEQMKELTMRSDAFRQITASMQEGLVLLDAQGRVLSINAAAQTILSVKGDATGKDFLAIDRTLQLSRAVEQALQGQHGEFREERGGRVYQFLVNHTMSEGHVIGVVILCIDISEAEFAERNRREFTANVSHELKTPLQSIIGSAELMEHGLVKAEDTPRFIGTIRQEATGLVNLINDIILLSRLDEEVQLPNETVEMREVAESVIDVLQPFAEKRKIHLSVEGDRYSLSGVRRYLYEVVYNLCDNALRYNIEGGKVTIRLTKADGKKILAVSDTGIGIAKEHQSRIFERFYRVDKSHSKETGGTGLGLSIVKHGVRYHNGSIKLDSELGKGTTITVIFT